MRRLVFITQQVDPAHPALAATVPKVQALAARLDEVVVLADGAVPGTLPANCRVRTFAAGTKVGRGTRFGVALATELARGRPLAVVAHMCPIYAVLAAPLARPLRVPVLLWFTHWHASPTLKAAARVSNTILSVDRRSVPLRAARVRAIGHGIDLRQFTCERNGSGADGLRLLSLGRYSPAKGLDSVLRAIRLATDNGLDVHLQAHGPTLSPLERRHRDELERLVHALRLEERAHLGEPVPRERVPELFGASDALVNNMQAGAPDKVVYEAAASCLPVLASNPVFDRLLPEELRFERDRPASLADRLAAFASRPPDERAAVGRALRARVAREHSVEHWADSVIAAAEGR
jgi:glycosyltransferase involved in cell wall biosynthesis